MAHQAENPEAAAKMAAEVEDQTVAIGEFGKAGVNCPRNIEAQDSRQDGDLDIADCIWQPRARHGVWLCIVLFAESRSRDIHFEEYLIGTPLDLQLYLGPHWEHRLFRRIDRRVVDAP